MAQSFETQKAMMRTALMQGRVISSWEVIQKYHITRLAAIIHRLKSEGYSIESKWETGADKKRYKSYFMTLMV